MTIDMITTAQATGFGTVFLAILGGLIRFFIKIKNASAGESISVEINNTLLKNLRDEIARLEKVIGRLNNKITLLENSINSLRNIEIESAIDFGALESICKNMPCMRCTSQGEAFVQMREVVERMKKRREERKKLINVAVKVETIEEENK